MSLYLEQQFPLGRFHATRWNQGTFGDRYGEWPPSPWRLLRALAFRWFQWSRETGETNERRLNELLNSLGKQPPKFYVPELTWRGPPVKQYLPTDVAWTDAKKGAAAYKETKKTLNEDNYRAISPEACIYWVWPDLSEIDVELLDSLLVRILYFGRAESWTRIKRVDSLPSDPGVLCTLEERSSADSVPVLASIPGRDLEMKMVLEITENLRNREIPPGTMWFFARLPKRPKISSGKGPRANYPNEVCLLQFAIGGKVFPPRELWVKVAERFRGSVLLERLRQITGVQSISYSSLDSKQKGEVKLLSGKDEMGRPLENHQHAYFALIPDENDQPTRLVVWRETPFTQEEIEAFLSASEGEIRWDHSTSNWPLKVVPLPFDASKPTAFSDKFSIYWRSLTPFVPPSSRKRFRKNGKERPGETPEMVAVKIGRKKGLPQPIRVEIMTSDGRWIERSDRDTLSEMKSSWSTVHQTLKDRKVLPGSTRPNRSPGYYLRLTFNQPVRGPIILGESSHFGLGLFVPESP